MDINLAHLTPIAMQNIFAVIEQEKNDSLDRDEQEELFSALKDLKRAYFSLTGKEIEAVVRI